MKLIDLLVQELPKRGGWPDGATFAFQRDNKTLEWQELDIKHITLPYLADDYMPYMDQHNYLRYIVRRGQYEAALAASQKVEWDGNGLPPVGTECEFLSNDTTWGKVVIIGYDGDRVVFKPSGETYYGIEPSERQIFRPLRTEREKAITQMLTIIDCHGVDPLNSAAAIYAAIVAGNIDGLGKVG